MNDSTNATRIGIAGMGGISAVHLKALKEIPEARVAAVCDVDQGRAEAAAKAIGAEAFTDYRKMLDSKKIEAAIITTPHSTHVEIVKAALARNIHVLSEKPLGVHVKSAREAVAAAKSSKALFAIVFQHTAVPMWIKVRELLAAGEIGTLRRAIWIITDWYRSQAYYASDPWRGTWEGEGGGVLLNQCPHQLDMFQWLVGMPDRVRAFVSCGKHHKIQVEDDVTAYMEWNSGMTASFITTTGDFPGTNRLEITGDRGRMIITKARIELQKTKGSVAEHSRVNTERWGKPGVEDMVAFDFDAPQGGQPPHAGILQNFVAAIRTGAPLVAPGAEGLKSLELANAMVYSGLRNEPVSLPLDGAKYEKLLQELCANGKA